MIYGAIKTKGCIVRHECRDSHEFVNGLLMMYKCGMTDKEVLWAGKLTPEELEAAIAADQWVRGIPAGGQCDDA